MINITENTNTKTAAKSKIMVDSDSDDFASGHSDDSDGELGYSPDKPENPKMLAGLAEPVKQSRAEPRTYPLSKWAENSLYYCVYMGNFPKVVRNAMNLR